MKIIDVSVNSDKYRVVLDDKTGFKCYRYGEEWKDIVGDNLIYWLAAELQEARDRINTAVKSLEVVLNGSLEDDREVYLLNNLFETLSYGENK